ncbi:MAG: sulfite exporter TauE/SafE family protein [Mediterranea massiliensis]|nr:sulfite exporter TauE/SafE family protein [Mediterranea massiliensis]
MMITVVWVLLLTIIAAFIQRVTGFGFGIFVMMFFPYILTSYGASTALSGLLAGSTALLIAIRQWRYIRWRLMFVVLSSNIIVSFLAIHYMASLSNVVLKRSFGAMFALIALYFLFGSGKIRFRFRSSFSQGVIGALSGVMGGMFAMPGPPLVLYCIGRIDDKQAYIATLQAFSVLLNVFYTLFRAKVGFFTSDTCLLWVVGLVGVVIGTHVGTCLFERISASALRKIVYLFLLVSGLIAMC